MRKLKTFVAALMLVFVLGISAPQTLAGELQTPPGNTESSPGQTEAPPGGTQGTGFASWANMILQICGNGWNV